MAVWSDTILDDYPILAREVHGHRLVYLDNAASSLTPEPVLQAMDAFYRRHRANVHRGLHALSAEATELYEAAREQVATFVGAGSDKSVVFCRGATSAINLVAQSWVRPRIKPGQAILITELEHHANLVSWQLLCQQTGAALRYIPIDGEGRWDLTDLDRLLTEDLAIVAAAHVSNVLGGINPVETLIAKARSLGVPILIDAAQSVGHMPVDFQSLGADFLTFSAHKMCGPTGIGALIAKPSRLEKMEPIEGGGDMIVHVEYDSVTWNQIPYRFEAGTPPIAEVIGLGAATEYLNRIGLDHVLEHTQRLTERCVSALQEVEGVRVLGPATERCGPVSFVVAGLHPHDLAEGLNFEGVAVRAGHHCAQPLHAKLGVPASSRASFYLVNIPDDIDRLVAAIGVVRRQFGV